MNKSSFLNDDAISGIHANTSRVFNKKLPNENLIQNKEVTDGKENIVRFQSYVFISHKSSFPIPIQFLLCFLFFCCCEWYY